MRVFVVAGLLIAGATAERWDHEAGPKGAVCITGVSGFIGSNLASQLLDEGYSVTGTTRSVAATEVMFMITGPDSAFQRHRDRFMLKEADLMNRASLEEAFSGADCHTLMHVASPFFNKVNDPVTELIIPAENGTANALSAALEVGIQQVVLTSSCAAVTPQFLTDPSKVYDERDWQLDSTVDHGAYRLSKRLAEQTAWRMVGESNGALQLAVVLPSFVLGPPVLPRATGESVAFMQKLLAGQLRGNRSPSSAFGVVDVRDVARAHIRCMQRWDAAQGQRFIMSSSSAYTQLDLANLLKADSAFVTKGFVEKFPTGYEDGKGPMSRVQYRNDKAAHLLGITPRPARETLLDMANTVLDLHLA